MGRHAAASMTRLDSRDYTWYALCVPPQRELVVEKILANAGFAVFVPLRMEYRFANRAGRGRREKIERKYPIIPRIVFIGMNGHTPGWWGVLRFRIVTSIIGRGNIPAVIPHDTRPATNTMPERPGLRHLIWRYNEGQFMAPSHQQYMVTQREFEVGDLVQTDDELFVGRVVELSGNMATVFIELFGGTTKADINIEKLLSLE